MDGIIIGDSNSLFIEIDGFNNLAVAGHRVSDALDTLQGIEGGYTFIIGVGVNDSASIKDLRSDGAIRPDIDEFKSSYSTLLDLAKAKFKNVIVLGLVCSDEKPTILGSAEIRYSNDTISEFNDCIKNLCESEGVKFVDLLPYFLGREDELLDDHIHPNEIGKEIILSKLLDQTSVWRRSCHPSVPQGSH